MKKTSALFCVIFIVLSLFASCAKDEGSESNNKIQIVSTVFAGYDWVREITSGLSANTEITMLSDNNTDLHSYQATAGDLVRIKSCDLIIYVGGESDKWVKDALNGADTKSICLLNVLGDRAKTEELAEGMQEEEHHEGDEAEADEHVWLSLKNAELFVNSICDEICALDGQNAQKYKDNAKAYTEKIARLDSEYTKTAENSKRNTVLFGDRFPFRYLCDDYGIKYYAAFNGCSSETEASFETIAFLSKKVDELDLPCVLVIESSRHRIAQTVIENTANKDRQIMTVNSIQSVSSDEIKSGITYLSIMEENLKTLKAALN